MRDCKKKRLKKSDKSQIYIENETISDFLIMKGRRNGKVR